MTRLRPSTVALVVLAIAAAIALTTGTAGPPGRKPMASQPSSTPTAVPTPAPAQHPARELDRQDRPTRRQRRRQRRAMQQHRLLDQLPVKLAGAEVVVTGIAGHRTRLRLTGARADALLAQALLASGDDAGRYLPDGRGSGDTPQLTCVLEDPVCTAVAYATAASTYGPASARAQEHRRRALAAGPLRRAARMTAGDDTQITLVTAAHLDDVADGRSADVSVMLASQRRRGGALVRRSSTYSVQLVRADRKWRVRTFSIDPGSQP